MHVPRPRAAKRTHPSKTSSKEDWHHGPSSARPAAGARRSARPGRPGIREEPLRFARARHPDVQRGPGRRAARLRLVVPTVLGRDGTDRQPAERDVGRPDRPARAAAAAARRPAADGPRRRRRCSLQPLRECRRPLGAAAR
eukprot:95836-Prymnesium_polylepis.1